MSAVIVSGGDALATTVIDELKSAGATVVKLQPSEESAVMLMFGGATTVAWLVAFGGSNRSSSAGCA
ncbi:hypothetical protein [Mycobacterium sp.]|uniref:hypothetical protein n=1 Tax=Mycobacterium sp. TaxID=1785 RepID=UPI0031E1AAA6